MESVSQDIDPFDMWISGYLQGQRDLLQQQLNYQRAEHERLGISRVVRATIIDTEARQYREKLKAA